MRLFVDYFRNCSFLIRNTYSIFLFFKCFVAIAVPLNIPHHNAFVSYNFETAYGLPKNPKDFLPEKYQGFALQEGVRKNDTNQKTLYEDTSKASKTKRNSLESINTTRKLTQRRAIYQMIQDKLKISGFKGKACLLKLVCEIISSSIGRNNGVLGTILHILISPSSSAPEKLSSEFYKAESNGLVGNCFQYGKRCPYGILDLFSVQAEKLLKEHLNNVLLKNN